jgi:hypothetical protein
LESATEVTVVTPPHDKGLVDIVVKVGEKTSTSAGVFTFSDAAVAEPELVVSGVAPDQGATSGGETVTITGEGFAGSPTVFFGTVAGSSVALSGSTLTVVTPKHDKGLVDIVVKVGEKTSTSAGAFTFSDPAVAEPELVVSGVTPATGKTAGGENVKVTGKGFIGALEVLFGDIPVATTKLESATELTVETPPQKSGVVDVVVKAGQKSATSPGAFTYGD